MRFTVCLAFGIWHLLGAISGIIWDHQMGVPAFPGWSFVSLVPMRSLTLLLPWCSSSWVFLRFLGVIAFPGVPCFLGSSGVIWHYLGSSGNARDHLRSSELIWAHLGSCGGIWDHQGSSGIIWDHLGIIFAVIWAHLEEASGIVLDNLGSSGIR